MGKKRLPLYYVRRIIISTHLKCPFVLTAWFGICGHSSFDCCNIFATSHLFFFISIACLCMCCIWSQLFTLKDHQTGWILLKTSGLGYSGPAAAAGFLWSSNSVTSGYLHFYNQLTSCNSVRALVGQVLWEGIFKSAFHNFVNPKVKSWVEELPTVWRKKLCAGLSAFSVFVWVITLITEWYGFALQINNKWRRKKERFYTVLFCTPQATQQCFINSCTGGFSLLKLMAYVLS